MERLSKIFLPVLVLALIGSAFGLGVLYQKVQFLEKGSASLGANPSAGQAPTLAQPTPVVLDSQAIAKLGAKGFSKGDPNAKVTVVEFADYQCPFCERLFTQVIPSLDKEYVNTGKVRFVYRDYAFLGQESTWSAEAARCANEQGKFWQYHDYLFTHQGAENSGAFSKANLKKFAVALGLNASQFNTCLDSDKYATEVSQDFQEGQAAGVNGTPGSFVNGVMINGAVPYATFKTAIDAALAK